MSRESSLIKGMDFVLKDLKKEMKLKSFRFFDVEHERDPDKPYPGKHDLLKLGVYYKFKEGVQKRVFEYLKSSKDKKWWRCENFKKTEELK